jgi:hypothetical protein
VREIVGNRTVASLAGVLGIVGQLAAAYWFVLVPALTVPTPATYLFVAAWFVLVGLAIAWWRHHPWRSFLVPVVSAPIVILVLEFGTRSLGWAP